MFEITLFKSLSREGITQTVIQLMHSFRGTTAPASILEAVRNGEIASFCLFNFNYENPAQLSRLTDSLNSAALEGGQLPPLIGIDQEGGQLMAIASRVTELPGNLAIGATRSPELAEQAGRVLARELLAMGINLNFAPSLDVNSNPNNPVIGARAFGDDPALVAELGCAMIKGMQSEGMIATAKHFPGHGDVAIDTHYKTPIVRRDRQSIDSIDLLPFRAAIRQGVQAVMSAHIIFTALDPSLPATISPVIMTDLLRGELGFDGLLMTDAMDMHAIAERGVKGMEEALKCGVDLILLAHVPDQLQLHERLAHLENGDSVERIQRRQRNLMFTRPSLDVLNCADPQQTARNIAERAITVVRSEANLPLNLSPDDQIVVITPQPKDLTPADTSSFVSVKLGSAIAKRHARTISLELPSQPDESDIAATLQIAHHADVVIVGTIGAEKDVHQAELVLQLIRDGKRPIVVSLRTPYDILAFPTVETYLCAYGIRKPNTEAAARVLFGEIKATGTLPCVIPGITAPVLS
jgi:beta-N-acetylhexosaminidase